MGGWAHVPLQGTAEDLQKILGHIRDTIEDALEDQESQEGESAQPWVRAMAAGRG